MQRAVTALEKMKSRLDSVERANNEPIAIIGMACRFPGGGIHPEAFWNVLDNGVDAIGEIPVSRWHPSAISGEPQDTRWAALLGDLSGFDANFFGISPREAETLDPQHRMLLEVAWEAMEDAGLRPETLSGSRTGVLVGMSNNDYQILVAKSRADRLDGYCGTGNLFSTAAGRVAFTYNFQGPTFTIDTACSSALVATAQACHLLRTGDADLAFVGGVNAILAPYTIELFHVLQALSADGRCKTFDARANGYARGEGCGLIILKKLSNALRDGDRIRGVIRGWAVNQDGRSTGLTTPNVLSQQAMLRQALSRAHLAPTDIDYIEVHGTGTPLGDPIEADALREVMGVPRPDGSKLVLGAGKTNVGHLEGAAGMVGIIKILLSMEHEQIPKNLHFRRLNPRISFDGAPFIIPTAHVPWPRKDKPRRAGTSAFGFSGTNAHVILEEPPATEARGPIKESSAYLLPISAKTPEARTAYAAAYAEWFAAGRDEALYDIVHTATVRRTHHEYRLAAVARTKDEFAKILGAYARGETPAGVVDGQATSREAPKIVFVFSGQGSQWAGMGKRLLDEEPVFRAKVEQIDALIRKRADFSVLDELRAPEDTSRLSETEIVQPAIFALQVALVDLLQSWGISPNGVLGHSVGEVAAAYVSGALSLEDAVRLIVLRGRIMQEATGRGKMVWVALPATEAAIALTGLEDKLSIAAINDPGSVVLSGDSNALDVIIQDFEKRGVATRPLRVNYAFHSPQMAPLARELVTSLGPINAKASTIPMYSSLTGRRIDGNALVAEYWGLNVLSTVNFADAAIQAFADNHLVAIEIGPHPVLLANLEQCASSTNHNVRAISTLRRQTNERQGLLEAVGALHTLGAPLDWSKLLPDKGQLVPLPAYPWQRKRYWIDTAALAPSIGKPTGHQLLGNAITVAGVEAVSESTLDPNGLAWLNDHRVFGEVILPGAALLEMARAAGAMHLGANHCQVLGFAIQAPLRIAPNTSQRVQVLLEKGDRDDLKVRIYSQPQGTDDEHSWVLHAQGTVRSTDVQTAPSVDLGALREREHTTLDVCQLYEGFARLGLDYGPSFQGIRELRRNGNEVVAELALSDALAATAISYGMHPALLDAGLQCLMAVEESSEGTTYLPFEFGEATFFGPAPMRAWVHARLEPAAKNAESVIGSVSWMDETGRVFATIANLRAKRANAESMRQALRDESAGETLFRLDWISRPRPEAAAWPMGEWLVIGESSEVIASIGQQMASAGAVSHGSSFDSVQERLARFTAAGTKIAGILCCWDESHNNSIPRLAEICTVAALNVVQSIVRAGLSTKLFFVTNRGVALGAGEALALTQSPLWGFGRVVRNEHPDLGCKLIDIDAATNDSWLCELMAADDEPEVVWRNEKRFVARLVKATSTRGLRIPEGDCIALAIGSKGELSNLHLEAVARRAPTAGEIEIEVHASGLNFRDVLNALGMYPGDAGPLGGECAGVVAAVGPGVTEFAIGDHVMALVAGAFRSFVTVDIRFVARVPSGVSLAQAATIPLVFLTAHYALHDLGHLKRGERILVHAAAGGVGMAAVQMARHIGAEVFATASPSKWPVVRRLGVERVANSRTLEFANVFRDGTQGRGVDVVLNSLAGDFIDASLSLLSPGGRFLEMGKTDIRATDSVHAAYPDRKYRAFDLPEAGPDRIHEMFGAILEGFASGAYKPLPLRGFGLTDAEEAFRTMAQAQHIGKIVLRAVPRRTIAKKATVIVTGGLGALGMHVARWLWQQHRVAHLVLASRHAPTPEKVVEIERLRSDGAVITVAAVDVADLSSVQQLVQSISSEYPLRGIIHAAGVIDDGLLSDQHKARFSTVFGPKVYGAWNLHDATRHLPLDFFVMFSSVASVLGSAGQSNYAAANAFLDALAHARHAEGLSAQSVHWGAWSEGGMAAELSETLQSRLSRMGMGMISPAQGLSLLGAAIGRPEGELVAMSLDVQALGRNIGHDIPAIWRNVLTAKVSAGGARPATNSWREHLGRLPAHAREAEVTAGIREDVAKVMSFGSANDVPEDRPLQELGLDSLMAVELRNAISARVATRLPATLLFDYPTVKGLRKHLLDKVLVFEAPIAAPAPPKATVTRTDDAIAIIGAGCRFPGGVHDLDAFWGLLQNEVDAIREVPRDRWDIDAYYDPNPDAPGKMTTRWGGFLEALDLFEPGFFGISPREAESLDPQQRLLLETTWEALERAGIPADQLIGTDTGVYVGICSSDYQQRTMTNMDDMNAYSLLGTAHSAIVGRISYWLGLQGPNMAIDTACSSSLVSVHLACRAIRAGECSMAIAGGVNVMLSPAGTVYFSRLKAISPTGRCHTFAAEADGYVRSEGCAMVVLKRLSDAIRDGDSILALIRGTAVNQDGRSQGLTAPNGPAQEQVIRSALNAAAVRPAEIDYVEAHGTGTPLGDPIEVQALANVLGEGRDPDKPVLLGSVKTNIGHSEGAAGIAGLVKTTLCLMHEAIPRSLHFANPNLHIAWSDLPVRVAHQSQPWRRNGKRRLAGVSSFGFSGTNAHIVLEEPPPEETRTPAAQTSAYFLPLSAKSAGGLTSLATNLAEWLRARVHVPLHDIVFTANVRRTHHEHRLAAAGSTHEEFATMLEAFARRESPADVVHGSVSRSIASRIVFVFSGQGSQWPGMGSALLEEEPVFRAKVEQIDMLIRRHANFSLLDELRKPEETSRLGETEIVQPALFAIQVGLVELFKSWGIVPQAVMGHSVGEIAAAHVSSAISLEDAVCLVVLRGRMMQKATGHGKMVWVALPASQAEREIAEYKNDVAIAAINDPKSVVLSGDPPSLDALVERLDKRGIATRPLRVNYAFHSPQMAPLAAELVATLGPLPTQAPTIALYSTVTGNRIDHGALGVDYWGRNVRETVCLAQAVNTALDDRYQLLVEIGPHPVLLANLEQCAASKNLTISAVATLRRQYNERRALLKAAGALYAVGVGIDAKKLGVAQGQVVPLPTYPWQRERYWIEGPSRVSHAPSVAQTIHDPGAHPLLGADISLSALRGAHVFQQRLRPDSPSYLQDHQVANETVFPGTGYVEMALAAAASLERHGRIVLENIAIEQKLVLEASGALVQLTLEDNGPDAATFRIASRGDGSTEWLRHATGSVRFVDMKNPDALENPSVLVNRFSKTRTGAEHYARMSRAGLEYRSTFRGIDQLWYESGRAIARIVVPDAIAGKHKHRLHPALLDACFQAVDAAATGVLQGTYLPIGVHRLVLWNEPGTSGWVDVQLRPTKEKNPDVAEADLRFLRDDGQIVVEVTGLRIKRLAQRADQETSENLVHTATWRNQPLEAQFDATTAYAGAWLIFSDRDDIGDSLIQHLRSHGARCIRVSIGNHFTRRNGDDFAIDPTRADDYRTLLNEAFPGHAVCRGIIHLWSLQMTPREATTTASLAADLQIGCVGTLHLVQALARFGWRDIPPLVLVTRDAQRAQKGDSVNVAQAPLWGLGRTISLEHPEIFCKRVDLDRPTPSHDDALRILHEVIASDNEDQVAFRGSERLVARLTRGRFATRGETIAYREPARDRPYQLWQPEPGILERLELRPAARRKPGPGEVEVEVVAAGVNFIDVLMAMGIYPGMKSGGTALGGDFAGRIVAMGEGITDFTIGQEVMGSAHGAFATHITVDARFVVPKPHHLTFGEAAAIPAVFMTVHYALCEIGRARKGERILIHAATGGTGLAAVQVARSLGLEIFATAGNEEKRDYLRRLGITHVMDSRTLRFAEQIQDATGGDGVDLVLNSLTGDAIAKGFEILAPYGRFLELGKRDIYDNERLGLLPFRKSLSYTAIDLAGMRHDKPALYASLLREVADKFATKTLQPLPVQSFPASRADEAFRLLAQAKHIGKIVVEMRDPAAEVAIEETLVPSIVRPDAMYLVTGGLGGLGLIAAKWLVERGGRHVGLIGRSLPSKEAEDAMVTMREAGAHIVAFQADVSKPEDIQRVLSAIDSRTPVRGIIHAAGLLADHSLLEMSAEHIHQVMGPKMMGAWNLHVATRRMPLDFFVMYSSSAGLLGSPGQGNYAAANAFLDALAHDRNVMGLVAMSVQWGPFSEVGMAAASAIRGGRAASRGMEPLSPSEGLDLLQTLLIEPRPEVGIMRLDMRRFQEFYPQVVTSPYWSDMRVEAQNKAALGAPSAIHSILEQARPAERIGTFKRYLVEQLGRVLRIPSDRIGVETPFVSLGVDSLMSLEMRNRLEADLQLKLPSTLLFTYPDTTSLADYLFARVVPATPSEPQPVATPAESHGEPPVVTAAEVAPAASAEAPTTAATPETGPDDFLSAFDASLTELMTLEDG